MVFGSAFIENDIIYLKWNHTANVRFSNAIDQTTIATRRIMTYIDCLKPRQNKKKNPECMDLYYIVHWFLGKIALVMIKFYLSQVAVSVKMIQ